MGLAWIFIAISWLSLLFLFGHYQWQRKRKFSISFIMLAVLLSALAIKLFLNVAEWKKGHLQNELALNRVGHLATMTSDEETANLMESVNDAKFEIYNDDLERAIEKIDASFEKILQRQQAMVEEDASKLQCIRLPVAQSYPTVLGKQLHYQIQVPVNQTAYIEPAFKSYDKSLIKEPRLSKLQQIAQLEYLDSAQGPLALTGRNFVEISYQDVGDKREYTLAINGKPKLKLSAASTLKRDRSFERKTLSNSSETLELGRLSLISPERQWDSSYKISLQVRMKDHE